jgi:small-conductance mechanosensitive channel
MAETPPADIGGDSSPMEEITKALLDFVLGHTREQMAALSARLDKLIEQGAKIMATQAEFTAALDAINKATNEQSTSLTAIVTLIEGLRKQVTDAGLPQAEEQKILASLQQAGEVITAQAAVSAAIAANPGDPVPAAELARLAKAKAQLAAAAKR